MAGGQWVLFAATHAAAILGGALVMYVRCCLHCDRCHHIEDEPPPPPAGAHRM